MRASGRLLRRGTGELADGAVARAVGVDLAAVEIGEALMGGAGERVAGGARMGALDLLSGEKVVDVHVDTPGLASGSGTD